MPRRRLLLSALLVSVLIAPLAAQPAGPGSGRVEGAEALNVRSGPGLENDIVGALRRGDDVEVKEVDGKWARVRHRDTEGWVFASFIAMRDGGAPAAAALATPTATATPGAGTTPVGSEAGGVNQVPASGMRGAAAPPPVSAEIVDEIRGDVDRILTLTEAMHHDLERQRNSPPSASRGNHGISVQSGVGLLALGAVLGLLIGTILGRQQERRGRPRVRL
jgi:uncharacterized protein YraI